MLYGYAIHPIECTIMYMICSLYDIPQLYIYYIYKIYIIQSVMGYNHVNLEKKGLMTLF